MKQTGVKAEELTFSGWLELNKDLDNTCEKCEGDGVFNCDNCDDGSDKCQDCDGNSDCLMCNGNGYDVCLYCGGLGEIECKECQGNGNLAYITYKEMLELERNEDKVDLDGRNDDWWNGR